LRFSSLIQNSQEREYFKESLYEYIELREKPFTRDDLIKNCHWPVDWWTVQDALAELEQEGRIIRLNRYGEYLSLEVLRQRWIKERLEHKRQQQEENGNTVFLSTEFLQKLERTIKSEWGYNDVSDFIRDAIRHELRRKTKHESENKKRNVT